MNRSSSNGFLTGDVAADVTDGKWLKGMPTALERFAYDTRKMEAGEVFMALRDKRDGHDFVKEACQAGASAAVVSREIDCELPQLVVKDTLQALRALASWQRSAFNGEMVMVTGSSGKSTVKDMLLSIFTAFVGPEAAMATRGNLNNHIGLPLTLLRLRASQAFSVVEAGMNHAGEIADLATLAKPTLGLITNAGRAHLGHFDSVEGIARAKGELLQALEPGSPAVLNCDDRFYPLWKEMAADLEILAFSHEGKAEAVCRRIPDRDFLYNFDGTSQPQELCLQVYGEHNERNAMAAATAAWRLGVPCDVIREGLENFVGSPGRQEILDAAGAIVINDTYNASPESFKIALTGLKKRPERTKFLIMGDMLELGEHAEEIHLQMVNMAYESGIERILAFGEHSGAAVAKAGGEHYASKAELIDDARKLLGAGCVILVKGSHGMHMEEVALALAGK